MNNHVIFSWNPDEEDDDLNNIMRNTDDPLQMHSSYSGLINQSSLIDVVQSTSMASSSSVFQPLVCNQSSSAGLINQSTLIDVVQSTSMASSSSVFQPLASSDHASPSITTTSSGVFGFWSDVIQPSPPPPQSLQQKEQDQLRELLFLQQQQQMQNFVYPLAGQSTIPFPAQLEQGEPSSHHVDNAPLMSLEYYVPSQRYQVATPGISIGKNNRGNDEHNKRLKSVQTAHTISEKRRREKFKGKMKALEELLPKCDKKDTASILDEAIKQIKLLKFQAQWMQEQYMSSTIRAISQPHIPTLPSPLIPAQLMDRTRPNVVGMVPYHAMLHYPAVATMIPRMQMFPMIPPLLPFTTAPSSITAAPRATLTPRGPPTRVTTNVPGEGEGDGSGGRLASPSSRGCRRDTQ